MKIDETAKVVAMIKHAYPNWLRADVDVEALVSAWQEILGGYKYETIKGNLLKHITVNKFAPAISDLTEGRDPRDGKAHPDGGVWFEGKQLMGAEPWN